MPIVEPKYNINEHSEGHLLHGTAKFFERWVSNFTRAQAGLKGELSFLMTLVFAEPFDGIGFDGDDSCSVTGLYDGEWMPERFLPKFNPGERYVVGDQGLGWTIFPQRVYTRLEFEGWVHHTLNQLIERQPEHAEMIREIEASHYDLDAVEGLIQKKLDGELDWEYNYPLDNPAMMQLLAETFPNYDYDKREFRRR